MTFYGAGYRTFAPCFTIFARLGGSFKTPFGLVVTFFPEDGGILLEVIQVLSVFNNQCSSDWLLKRGRGTYVSAKSDDGDAIGVLANAAAERFDDVGDQVFRVFEVRFLKNELMKIVLKKKSLSCKKKYLVECRL